MTVTEVRKAFEHGLLPGGFYQDKKNFIGMILNNNGVLFEILDGMFKENGVENPYKADQISVVPAKLGDGISMLKISFPEPEEEPLCYWSYLFFDEKFEKMLYFCIEKTNGGPLPLVGAWTDDRQHLSFGNCMFEDNDDFRMCSTVFKSAFSDKRNENETETE